ncbi:hypothetical protein AZE42_09503, partial [Rhizopogon vesiculosus]
NSASVHVIADFIPHILPNSLSELTLLALLLKLDSAMRAIRVPSQHNVELKYLIVTWTQVLVSLSPTSSPASTVNDFTVMVDGASVRGETIHFAMSPPKFNGRANGLRTLLVVFSCHKPGHQACITSLHLVLTRSFQNDLPKRVGYMYHCTLSAGCSVNLLYTQNGSSMTPPTRPVRLLELPRIPTRGATAAQYFSCHLIGKSDLIKVYSHNVSLHFYTNQSTGMMFFASVII